MSELELLPSLLIFFAGVIVGVAGLMISNKLSSGSVSAGKIKKEKDDYQAEVEAHFAETSKKFKQMATQYQDLYQHMSVGATTLCRPENIAPGLTDQTDPLASTQQPVKPEPTESKRTNPEQPPKATTTSQIEEQKATTTKKTKPVSTKIDKPQSAKSTKSISDQKSASVSKNKSAHSLKSNQAKSSAKGASTKNRLK